MDHDQLVELINQNGLMPVARAVQQPALQVKHGWDLHNWRVKAGPGTLIFYQVSNGLVTGGPRVLVLNRPEVEREYWQRIADESDAPVTLLMHPMGTGL